MILARFDGNAGRGRGEVTVGMRMGGVVSGRVEGNDEIIQVHGVGGRIVIHVGRVRGLVGQMQLRDAARGGTSGILLGLRRPAGQDMSCLLSSGRVEGMECARKITYLACCCCSRSLRFKLIAIIRQVRFSMRSWLGN